MEWLPIVLCTTKSCEQTEAEKEHLCFMTIQITSIHLTFELQFVNFCEVFEESI